MNIRSAKQKGRRLALDVIELLYKYWPDGQTGDLRATSGSVGGEDILLSPAAHQIYPFSIECKNQETIKIWEAYEQAQSHADSLGMDMFSVPTVFFKRNRSEIMVCLKAEDFIRLIR